MFSGIIESVQPIVSVAPAEKALRIRVSRPSDFSDLKIGDSIATNGVCLTVEALTESDIVFALAAETLKILGVDPHQAKSLIGTKVNLERSLRFGDRIHGHLVTGHVDSKGKVLSVRQEGESLFLDVQVQNSMQPFVWNKGSITLHGVSLTVNLVSGNSVSVCLIPETQKRTNLGLLKAGDEVNVEPDYLAKALVASQNFISAQKMTVNSGSQYQEQGV